MSKFGSRGDRYMSGSSAEFLEPNNSFACERSASPSESLVVSSH
jgi:hypothetical protein